jgi:putative FmdB family regulatory protein
MPIYEYKCEQTGNIYEVNQRINDAPFTKCVNSNCDCKGNSDTHRIISKNIGVIFNGGGFYETDYVRKNNSESTPSFNPPTPCGCAVCPHSNNKI